MTPSNGNDPRKRAAFETPAVLAEFDAAAVPARRPAAITAGTFLLVLRVAIGVAALFDLARNHDAMVADLTRDDPSFHGCRCRTLALDRGWGHGARVARAASRRGMGVPRAELRAADRHDGIRRLDLDGLRRLGRARSRDHATDDAALHRARRARAARPIQPRRRGVEPPAAGAKASPSLTDWLADSEAHESDLHNSSTSR